MNKGQPLYKGQKACPRGWPLFGGSTVVTIHHPEVMGKTVRVKYDDQDGCSKWYQGLITSFNCMTGKYSVFFPSDKTSEEFALDEDGLD